MKVDRLVLKNFRNLVQAEIEPSPRLNFLIGKNGQGKTSVLEALGYFASLRSFRGAKTAEVIRHSESSSEISTKISTECGLNESWESQLRVYFELDAKDNQKGNKTAFINEKPYRSSMNYLSQRFGNYHLGFHAVVFNPSDHDLVRGDPANRRSYLDRFIGSFDLEYLKTLQRYHRLLDQRNALLKSPERPSKEYLLGFTEPMGQAAAQIALKRLETIKGLVPYLNYAMGQIIPEGPQVFLSYSSEWIQKNINISNTNTEFSELKFAGHWPLPSLEQLEQAFWKELASVELAEWRAGHTLVGPQRDDWFFSFGDLPLKGHGSQGEVRSVLLSLKLAEVDWFRKATGHKPLFLLDDFSSELDQGRRKFLLKFLNESDLQVFVTTTEDSIFEGKKFLVENGKIESAGHGNL